MHVDKKIASASDDDVKSVGQWAVSKDDVFVKDCTESSERGDEEVRSGSRSNWFSILMDKRFQMWTTHLIHENVIAVGRSKQ